MTVKTTQGLLPGLGPRRCLQSVASSSCFAEAEASPLRPVCLVCTESTAQTPAGPRGEARRGGLGGRKEAAPWRKPCPAVAASGYCLVSLLFLFCSALLWRCGSNSEPRVRGTTSHRLLYRARIAAPCLPCLSGSSTSLLWSKQIRTCFQSVRKIILI